MCALLQLPIRLVKTIWLSLHLKNVGFIQLVSMLHTNELGIKVLQWSKVLPQMSDYPNWVIRFPTWVISIHIIHGTWHKKPMFLVGSKLLSHCPIWISKSSQIQCNGAQPLWPIGLNGQLLLFNFCLLVCSPGEVIILRDIYWLTQTYSKKEHCIVTWIYIGLNGTG